MNILLTFLLLLLFGLHQSTIYSNAYKIDNHYHQMIDYMNQESIIQYDNSKCQLSPDVISEIYDEETQIWLITDEIIKNDFLNDLQILLDCTSEKDILMFNTKNIIKLKNSVNIKTSDLTLTGYTEDVKIKKEGIINESDIKAVFTCPDDAQSAIFKIETKSITFANIEINDCNLNNHLEQASPIFFNYTCSKDENLGSVKFHYMNFRNNINHFKSGCFSKASQNNENYICMSLDILNVEFENNGSEEGYTIGESLPYTNMNNIKIKNNAYIDSDKALGILFYIAPEHELYVNELDAVENKGIIFYNDLDSRTTILNSKFEKNDFSNTLKYGLIYAKKSNILINYDEFSENKAPSLEIHDNSLVDIRDSLFSGSEDKAILTYESNLYIEKSSFFNNIGIHDASAIYGIDTDIDIHESYFVGNKASNGAIYISCSKSVMCNFLVFNSTFDSNVASLNDGGSISLANNINATISESIYFNNSAIGKGGAIAVNSQVSMYFNVQKSIFIENDSDDEGGAIAVGCEECKSSVTIDSCSFKENIVYHGNQKGGAIYIEGVTSNNTIQNSEFIKNYSHNKGGAIYLFKSEFEIENLTLIDNQATSRGGAILFETSNITVKNITQSNGRVNDYGGGIYIYGSEVKLENIILMDNHAASGAAICLSHHVNLTIRNSILKNNHVGVNGGVLYSSFSRTIIENTLIMNNTGDYGIIYMYVSQITILNSTIMDNQVNIDGGALNLYKGQTSIKNTTLKNNRAGDRGGSLYLEASELEIENSNLIDSKADYGGAAHLSRSYSNILNTKLVNNQAFITGGAIFLGDSQSIMQNTLLMNNQGYDGGALYAHNSSIIIQKTLFQYNIARAKGSVIYFLSTSFHTNITVNDSFFIDNDGCAFYLSALLNDTSDLLAELFLNNSVFDMNKNYIASGGVIEAYKADIVIKNCNFTNNMAINGGVISASDYLLVIIESSFINNSAIAKGGSVYLTHSTIDTYFYASELYCESNHASKGGFLYNDYPSNVTIEDSLFENNSVNVDYESHGSVLYSENLSGFCYLQISNCKILNSFAKGKGGAVYLKGYFKVEVKMSEFNQCISEIFDNYAGSVFTAIGKGWIFENELEKLGEESMSGYKESIQERYGVKDITDNEKLPSIILEFEDVKFERNEAKFATGALHVQDGVITEMKYCTFKNNNAQWAAAINTVNSEIYSNACDFIDNISSETAAALRIENTNENTNDMTVAVIKNSNFVNNEAKSGTVLESLSDRTAIYLLDNNSFIGNIASEKGGAISVNQDGFLYCRNSYFSSNIAESDFGGAIYINSTKSEYLKYYIENCYFENDKATYGGVFFIDEIDSDNNYIHEDYIYLYMKNVSFYSNVAKTAGGALMVDNPWMLAIECNGTHTLNPNEIGINGTYSIKDFDSTTLKTIDCLNWQNNTVVVDGYGEIMASNPTYISAEFMYDEWSSIYVSNGTFNNSRIYYQVYGMKSGSILPTMKFSTFDFFGNNPAFSVHQDLNLSIYSVYDDLKLVGDLEYNMNEGVVIINGIEVFGSPGIHIVYIDFSKDAFYDIILNFELRECQIGEEYKPNIGICQTCDFFTYNFDPYNSYCKTCPGFINCSSVALMPHNSHWLSGPCSIYSHPCIFSKACQYNERNRHLYKFVSALTTCNMTDTEIIEFTGLQCIDGYTGPLCGSCAPGYGHADRYECKRCSAKYLTIGYYLCSRILAILIVYLTIKANLTESVQIGSQKRISFNAQTLCFNNTITRKRTFIVKEEDENKTLMIETFKAFIDFIQLAATAMSINVNWYKYVKVIFGAFDFVGKMAENMVFTALECVIDESNETNRTLIRLTINILCPVLIFFIFVITWALKTIIWKKDFSYFLHRTVLSLLVISYLSYISITEYLVTFLYCDNIYNSHEFGQNGKTSSIWLEDTSVTCWTGSHDLFAKYLVIPFLIVFTFGFPFSIMVSLIYIRHFKVQEVLFFKETLGFLSSAYKENLNFWDAIVLSRKALLIVILVFAYPLGGNEQGLFAILILIFSFALHLYFLPFKKECEILNKCESASLLITIITYTCALFFYDPNTESSIKTVASVFVIFLNTLVVILYLYSIAYYFKKWAKAFLRRNDPQQKVNELIDSIHEKYQEMYQVFQSWSANASEI